MFGQETREHVKVKLPSGQLVFCSLKCEILMKAPFFTIWLSNECRIHHSVKAQQLVKSCTWGMLGLGSKLPLCRDQLTQFSRAEDILGTIFQ